jgi:hypothetical protein
MAVEDNEKWTFELTGPELDFEHRENYARRKICDRINDQVISDYCSAFGLKPFEWSFFSGPSILVRNPANDKDWNPSYSLAEARSRLKLPPSEFNGSSEFGA